MHACVDAALKSIERLGCLFNQAYSALNRLGRHDSYNCFDTILRLGRPATLQAQHKRALFVCCLIARSIESEGEDMVRTNMKQCDEVIGRLLLDVDLTICPDIQKQKHMRKMWQLLI